MAELSEAQIELPYLDEVMKNNTVVDSSYNGAHAMGGDYPYWADTSKISLANGEGSTLAHEGVHDHFLRNLGTDEALTERFEATMASMKDGEFVPGNSSHSGGPLKDLHADYTDDCAMEAYAAYVEGAVSAQVSAHDTLVHQVYNEPGSDDIPQLEEHMAAMYEADRTKERPGQVLGKGRSRTAPATAAWREARPATCRMVWRSC